MARGGVGWRLLNVVVGQTPPLDTRPPFFLPDRVRLGVPILPVQGASELTAGEMENPAIRSYVDELRAPSPALAPIIDLRGRGSWHGYCPGPYLYGAGRPPGDTPPAETSAPEICSTHPERGEGGRCAR